MAGRLLPWIAAAAFAAAAFAGAWWGGSGEPPVDRGAEAPDFSLPRLEDGSRVSLEDLEGRVVLLNFWATWCKPCEDEMPAMERLYRAFAGRDFELVAVSVDDEREAVETFRERLDLSFPIAWDPEQEVAESYQTYRFPETFLIDRSGVIVERYVGPREWDGAAYLRRIGRLLEADRAG